MSLLPLRALSLEFSARQKLLLRQLTFEIEAGPPLIILGPNGAGKSLLLRICHGMIAPTRGSIQWAKLGNANRRQAMVFQRPVMLRRSVAANLDYVLKVAGIPVAKRRSKVQLALARAGLEALANRPAPLLSGGEQQRLALARAEILRPDILFLDEPTSSLDPAATRIVEAMIEEISARGTKIVMSTHDIGQAKRLAGEVMFMHNGSITDFSQSQSFFRQPESEAAQAFLQGLIFV